MQSLFKTVLLPISIFGLSLSMVSCNKEEKVASLSYTVICDDNATINTDI